MPKTPDPGGRVKLRRKKLSDGRISLYLDTYDSGTRSYEFLKLYLTGNRTADAETLRIAEAHRSQRQIALELDMSPQLFVWAIDPENQRPSPEVTARIAAGLGEEWEEARVWRRR